MKLYDYLKSMPEGNELTVWDKDYDMEVYFYSGEDEEDRWQCALINLSKLLDITEIRDGGVIVNLSEIIEKKMDLLEETDLFLKYNIDAIMYSMDAIIAGNVSEAWMEKFVTTLKG